MQPYQNYLQYPPYTQTYNQPMPIQNPYMDRMAQLQQYQQNLQQPQANAQMQTGGIVGKVITDVSTVSPNDVPMDGTAAVFPKNDFSEIYVKSWTTNGTIQTVVYKPILEQNNGQTNNDVAQIDLNGLNNDFKALREEIAERFDRLEKSITAPAVKAASKPKKGEISNE